MSRRALIRAAAASGVAAWTAPVILGSIASPAAAGSACPSCTTTDPWGIAKWNKVTCSGDTVLTCSATDGNADCDDVILSCLGITHDAAFAGHGTCATPVTVTQHCSLSTVLGATISISGNCRFLAIFEKQGSGCDTAYCQVAAPTTCNSTVEFSGDFSHFIVAWCCS